MQENLHMLFLILWRTRQVLDLPESRSDDTYKIFTTVKQ